MKKITFIGNSPAIISAIEQIRATDQDSEVTLVSQENNYPYDQKKLNAFLAKECALNGVIVRPKGFFDKYRVNVLLEKNISRINLKKNRLTTEDKAQVDFDILVVSSTGDIRFPDVKGVNKEGVYSLSRLTDIKKAVDLLPIVETFVIQSDGIKGVQAAIAILKRGKDATIITARPYLLEGILNVQAANYLTSVIQENNGQVLANNTISEILGDSEAKAVRLRSGKVLASQIVLFDNTKQDLRAFSESSLELEGDGIKVNGSYQSNLEHVFAVDELAKAQSLDSNDNQGKIVGAKITGQDVTVQNPVEAEFIEFHNVNLVFIGKTGSGTDVQTADHFDDINKVYRKLYLSQGVAVGGVLVNCKNELEKISHLIENKENVVVRLDELLGKPQGQPVPGVSKEETLAEEPSINNGTGNP